MVTSKLDRTINYEENKDLNEDDKDMESSLFLIEVKEVEILCSVGHEKYTFIKKNVLYVPIYLIHKSKVVMKIGVYEFMASDLQDMMDEDDDLDLTKMDNPLIFSFVTTSLLEKYKFTGDLGDDEDVDESKDTSVSVAVETTKMLEGDVEIVDADAVEDVDGDIVGATDVADDEQEKGEDTDDTPLLKIGEEVEEAAVKLLDDDESLVSIQEKLKDEDVIPSEASVIKELFEEDTATEETEKHKQETKADAHKHNEAYKKGTNWLQKHFKNNNYTIKDNEGGGDCLFAVIRDAFASIGKDITVAQMRNILAREADETTFSQYKTIYDSFNVNLTVVEEEMKELIKANKDLKKKAKAEKDRSKRKILVDASKKNVERYKDLKSDRDYTIGFLEEYKFMEGVDTLTDFRRVVRTCKFWGETWTISTLERVLNIKLIILSKEAYTSGDSGNILQCGQLNDVKLEEKGEFKPKYYIITDWLGYHYKSVGYKGNYILTFEQIPYDIKSLVVDKCLERSSGPYQIIPKFKQLQEETHAIEVASAESSLESSVPELELELELDSSDTGTKTKSKSTTGSKSVSDDSSVSTSASTSRSSSVSGSTSTSASSTKSTRSRSKGDKLADDNIVFQYYEKSADKKPGKGAGEKIPGDKLKEFAALNAITHWRRQLSNMIHSEFELDGKKWFSVEHYYQASKFKKVNPEFFHQFSLDSKSELSRNAAMAKAAGTSKTGKYLGKEVRPKSIKTDSDFEERMDDVLYEALLAKFSQHDESKMVLKATKDATLVQYIRASPAKLSYELMEIRRMI
jgi:predicted NAD-dependent protein-ADP-ribosyltransferase YbiA (DUF1768 family)